LEELMVLVTVREDVDSSLELDGSGIRQLAPESHPVPYGSGGNSVEDEKPLVKGVVTH
jgi:hypothetical protein